MMIYALAAAALNRAALELSRAAYHGLAFRLQDCKITDKDSALAAAAAVKQVQSEFVDVLPEILRALRSARYAAVYAASGDLGRVEGYVRET